MAFPAVLQTAQTECGLGVSASILQHYGRYQTVSDLRLSMEPGREGLNLLQVSNLLTDEGMEVGRLSGKLVGATSGYRQAGDSALE